MEPTEELQATESLIVRLTGQLDELKEKKHQLDEMYSNIFANDEQLGILENGLKESQKLYKQRKANLAASQEALETDTKKKEVTEDIKMVEESLSTHLLTYYTTTNSMSFDISPTEEREYRIRAKVLGKPRTKKNAPAIGQLDIMGGEVK